MPERRPHLLILNGALAGAEGNTGALLDDAARLLARKASVARATLAEGGGFAAARSELERADGVLLGTGTHWDSWSSVLQAFLEEATPAEGTALWLGKPAAVVVTEHSVGGKGVLSRLQGVLATLGCMIPPMSGLVLAKAAVIAAKHDPQAARDFWCAEDLAIVCHNLAEAAALRAGRRTPARWRTWPVDRQDYRARWLG